MQKNLDFLCFCIIFVPEFEIVVGCGEVVGCMVKQWSM